MISKIKRLEDHAKFFVDNGILFELNRQVLYPLGLALEVIVDDETGKVKHFGGVWDYRDEDEGIRFDDVGFEDGLAKWNVFREKYVDEAVKKRELILGYIVQGDE